MGTGCSFAWVDDEAREEAEALLARDLGAVAELSALLRRMLTGRLRANTDYKQFKMVDDEPYLFELRLDSASPRPRLYFVEESHTDGARATGLALVEKPRRGSVAEQRPKQNAQARDAYARRQHM